MWTCKYCKKEFDFNTTSEKANHSRWCYSNINRNSWNKRASSDRRFGKKVKYTVSCSSCNIPFEIYEREKLYPQKSKYFCSRKCANSCGGKAKVEKYGITQYTTIAWKHHKKECVVCGENKIVEVHHLNEKHTDNRPENLVPLCPTHHQYWHSKYRHLIENSVISYVKKFLGGLVIKGNTPALQAGENGAVPLTSTI